MQLKASLANLALGPRNGVVIEKVYRDLQATRPRWAAGQGLARLSRMDPRVTFRSQSNYMARDRSWDWEKRGRGDVSK